MGAALPPGEREHRYFVAVRALGAAELLVDERPPAPAASSSVSAGPPSSSSSACGRAPARLRQFGQPLGGRQQGRVERIGTRIEEEADFIVSADDYVASIQPGQDKDTRHEQGVMVSMVDVEGTLVPVQMGERSVSPAPALIRRGLDRQHGSHRRTSRRSRRPRPEPERAGDVARWRT
ncbi:hypothetical protein ACIGW8_34255 [Streptomyces sioyaensis]|uniref:hypothetical protein n=1 Tax=Streptomyces sioyaensis TaxID=67364 RepID=UPI0037D8EF2D